MKTPHSTKKSKKQFLSLAQRILQYRLQREFTQSDVAAYLGISQAAYSNKETGIHHFHIEELFQLLELFGISIWEFFWDEMQNEAFERFARQKGYVHEESLLKELQMLKMELIRKEEIIAELKQDKEFLCAQLHAKRNNMKFARGGGLKL